MTSNVHQREMEEYLDEIGRRARSLRQQRLFKLALICMAVAMTSLVLVTMIVVLTVHVVEEVLR